MANQLTEKEIEERQKNIDEANKHKYNQSSKGSELIRKIVFAIIGSCWILMFTKGKYQETNIFLKATIAFSFIYLLLDVVHYFWDTCSYYLHAQNMERCETMDYVRNVYKPEDQHISRRSFVFFVLKVIACFVVSCAFVIGMFIEPLYGKIKHPQSLEISSKIATNRSLEFVKSDSVADGMVYVYVPSVEYDNSVKN